MWAAACLGSGLVVALPHAVQRTQSINVLFSPAWGCHPWGQCPPLPEKPAAAAIYTSGVPHPQSWGCSSPRSTAPGTARKRSAARGPDAGQLPIWAGHRAAPGMRVGPSLCSSTLLQHRLRGLQQGLLHFWAGAGGCPVPGSSTQRAPACTGGADAHPAQREEAVHREFGQRAAVPQHHECGHTQHHSLHQAAEHSVNLHQWSATCT